MPLERGVHLAPHDFRRPPCSSRAGPQRNDEKRLDFAFTSSSPGAAHRYLGARPLWGKRGRRAWILSFSLSAPSALHGGRPKFADAGGPKWTPRNPHRDAHRGDLSRSFPLEDGTPIGVKENDDADRGQDLLLGEGTCVWGKRTRNQHARASQLQNR